MDRLALYIAMMSGSGIAGTLLIIFFAFNWYSWTAIAVAGVVGLVTAWPTGRLISIYIKDRDPLFHRREPKGILPDPSGPEL
ncbi:hypothetical protein [uncultured Mameliella sp.]|uniref:hypothetical protein n=1 Tax=uncultured Mameliella sp. TaxID=1447087 RepID=UPI00260D9B26|nr:hypothetical protein [uncultured Mameliella sp.]